MHHTFYYVTFAQGTHWVFLELDSNVQKQSAKEEKVAAMEQADKSNLWIVLLRAAIAFFIIAGLAFFVLGYKRILEQKVHTNPILVVEGGYGTEEHPFLIATEEQFISIRDSVNRGYDYAECYFLQIADLDLQRTDNWVPIGLVDTPFYFGGYYDGGGHTIRGIVCSGDGDGLKNVALFGRLSGTVINLGLEESTFQGENAASLVYALSGPEAKIINCYSTADVTAQNTASGIAQLFEGHIVNCWYGGTIQGEKSATISAANPVSIYACLGADPLYTNSFVGHTSGSRTDITTKENAFSNMRENIADCARFLRMEQEGLVEWE